MAFQEHGANDPAQSNNNTQYDDVVANGEWLQAAFMGMELFAPVRFVIPKGLNKVIKMKKLILASMMFFLIQGAAHAMDQEGSEKGIQKLKSDTLADVRDTRSSLDKFESCVESAENEQKIDSCRDKLKQSMSELKGKGNTVDISREEASADFQKEREKRFKMK